MSLRTSQKLMVTLLALVGGVVILTALIIWPAIHGIRELNEEITKERQRIQTTIQRALSLRELNAQLEAIKKGLPELQEMLIARGKEIDLFNTIEADSRALELTETLRLSETTATSESIKKIPIQIELNGSFKNTLKFLENLEKNNVLIPIDKINMRVLSAQTSVSGFTATLNGNIYVTPSK
ncbi:type 4a pilus biogenesis protein PilO [Candidatus Uhrbacteria bacterium]|nr:type 4a pilus biogenesis protein PilO [Candidatus Uhrbacteria bacterium]